MASQPGVVIVRQARSSDVGRLQAIQLAAGDAFRGVPWNAPYYERLGFRELAPAEITPELAARRAASAAQGGDPAALVCMRRELNG